MLLIITNGQDPQFKMPAGRITLKVSINYLDNLLKLIYKFIVVTQYKLLYLYHELISYGQSAGFIIP